MGSPHDPVILHSTALRPRPEASLGEDIFAACLVGSALGDAVGGPVEFLTLDEIRARFGERGVTGPHPSFGLKTAAITDDTQLTLFTAEGLIRWRLRVALRGPCPPAHVVKGAYARWLETQEGRLPPPSTAGSGGAPIQHADGWLLDVPDLWSRRVPGNTCLSALRAARTGTLESPLNNSKGCGAVMRSAPVGLACAQPFRVACELAALTHGHPSGYLPAGVLASVVRSLARGTPLRRAVVTAATELRQWPGHEETLAAVVRARDAARMLPALPETVERVGRGWTGAEALAVALYCAEVAGSFEEGVLLAVNHSGDSDSTGALAGGLLGLRFGLAGLPAAWRAEVELLDVVERVARDLARAAALPRGAGASGAQPEWARPYPPH